MHGEQFVLSRVYSRGNQLQDFALSAEPCGHCRQWLNEMATADRLRILLPPADDGVLRRSIGFRDLLPIPFGQAFLAKRDWCRVRQLRHFNQVETGY